MRKACCQFLAPLQDRASLMLPRNLCSNSVERRMVGPKIRKKISQYSSRNIYFPSSRREKPQEVEQLNQLIWIAKFPKASHIQGHP